MSDVATADGVKLYYEERGTGVPVVFVHEFGGSCRSFDLQVEAFQGRHHCVVFNARGYPPSDVPASVDDYSQDIAAGDIAAVMDRLGIVKAHLVGVSMGAASALQFALRSRSRALSVTLVGIGSGSDEPEQFRVTAEANAKLIEAKGMAVFAEQMGGNPNERLSAMSSAGAANTMRGVQQRRPPIYAHKKGLASLRVPALVVVGEEDAGCRKPSEFIERTLPEARLVVVPGTGHVVNQEEPTEFNRLCLAFIDGVDARGR